MTPEDIRNPTFTISSPGGTGYLKRYSYDRCAATMPPPYFPTTGHYSRDQQYNVESVNFDIGAYFALLAPEG